MSFVKQFLEFNENDFNEDELSVIKLYFNSLLDRLAKNDRTLLYMNNIRRPEREFPYINFQNEFTTIEEKGLTRGESLLPRTYLYYEAFINNKPKYSDYICKFLEYFKKNAQNLLGSPIYYNTSFMEHFNKRLNDKEIVFLLFLLNDLNYITLSWGSPNPPHPHEALYENLKVNEITKIGFEILKDNCEKKKIRDLVYFSKKIRKKYVDIDYSAVHVKIIANKIDENQEDWLIAYLRIDFIHNLEQDLQNLTYSTDEKTIILQEIVGIDEFYLKFQNINHIYEYGDFQFNFHENLVIPTDYEVFKKSINTNYYQYKHIRCSEGMNLIFSDTLYSITPINYSKEIIAKDYNYRGEIVYGFKILEEIFGYTYGPPGPSILMVFPLKPFIFKHTDEIIDGKKYLRIVWDIGKKSRKLVYLKCNIGEKDSPQITESPFIVEIEEDFKGDVVFGIYWTGKDDLLENGAHLYINRFPYYNLKPKGFISFSNRDRNWAKKISKRLIESNIQVEFDEYELSFEDSLLDRIKDTLSASDYILFLISSNTVNSKWLYDEVNSGLIKEFKTRDITIIPILLEDCEIPSSLTSFSIIDLSENFELGLKNLIDQLDVVPKIDFSLLDIKSFEDLIYDLLKKLGFINIERYHKISNLEVDFKSEYKHKDPFNNEIAETWIIETKHYKNKRIDTSAILQITSFLSIFPSNTKGVLITTGHVTSVITDLLKKLEKRIRDNIIIIDSAQLKKLLLENKELIQKYFR